jgi:hypothetical protein
MAKSAEMATEVRSLDGDMQMLVYENYNKFISATDTIRSMKTNVDGMGSQMEELMSTIGDTLSLSFLKCKAPMLLIFFLCSVVHTYRTPSTHSEFSP